MPTLIDAHPDIELLIAGPGDSSDMTAKIPDAVRSHLRFLGLVSERDKVRAFKSADLYIAPNTGGESFGIVLLEAMAAGTETVASNIEAFSRVLEDGRCGGMFENESAEDLARVILALLADREGGAIRITEGKRRAKMYDWETVARDVARVYESVVSSGERVEADLSGQAFGRLRETRLLGQRQVRQREGRQRQRGH